MPLKDWEETVNQKDYIVWRNNKIEKQVAVYRNLFMVVNLKNGMNRNYDKKTQSRAMTFARSYMRTH